MTHSSRNTKPTTRKHNNKTRQTRRQKKYGGDPKEMRVILKKSVGREQGGTATGTVYMNSLGHIKIDIHEDRRSPVEPMEGKTATYYTDYKDGPVSADIIELYKKVIGKIECGQYSFNAFSHLGSELAMIADFKKYHRAMVEAADECMKEIMK